MKDSFACFVVNRNETDDWESDLVHVKYTLIQVLVTL